VRVEAAKAGQSVSRWVGQVLSARRSGYPSDREIEETLRLMDEFLAEPGLPLSEDEKAFDRAEIYDTDERFRRFDDPDLLRRSQRPGEASQSIGMAEGARPFEGPTPKSSGSK
jgi:hypothetical protein